MTTPPPAVDPSLRQQVMQQAQGNLSLALAYVGVTNHLYTTLHHHGPCTVDQLASHTGSDTAYVLRWADAAAAFGHLTRQGDAFALAPLGAAFLPEAPGTLMPVAMQAVMAAFMGERVSRFLATGERPGERVLGEPSSILPWFGPMLEATFGPIFADMVLPRLPEVAEVGERGGLAVDLGCGSGWYLRRLAARFPRLRGVGLDMLPANIATAQAAAAREGLSDRLDFHQGDLHHFTVDEPVDLVAMNRALHHVWAEGPAQVMAGLASHLLPGGLLVVWEPRWPDDPATLGSDPRLRGMAFQNLSEHVQGNHFLRPQEVEEAMRQAGLAPVTHLFGEGTEMVVVGRKAG